MKKTEFKVIPFQAQITAADLQKGLSHTLTAQQLQEVIDTHLEMGYELHQSIDIPVLIKPGCFGQAQTMSVTNLVFKK